MSETSPGSAGTPTTKVQYIWCNAQITKKMEDVFTNIVLNQAQQGQNVSEYVLYLTTTGGSPFSAINLYNFVKSLPQKTTVFNMGMVASAGVVFFLGFQNRYGVPDCSFMIHPTTTSRNFIPETLSVFDMATELGKLQATDDNTHIIIEKETKAHAAKPFTLQEIRDASLKTTFYRGQEAIDKGFIEKIEQPTISTPDTLYITDQWLATLPG